MRILPATGILPATRILPTMGGLLVSWGCATTWHLESVEKKVDRLLIATRREALTEIFGEQSREITRKMDELGDSERTRLDALLTEYQRGSATLDEVRQDLLSVMGGSTRVVSSDRGIWVRGEGGQKKQVLARDAKIQGCRRLEPGELPGPIADDRRLGKFSWGAGEVGGETVIFPWELTMSTFTREVVENTARRTAQEFLRMTEGKGWKRPVYIKVVTEAGEDQIQISPPGVEDVFVVPASGELPPE